MIGQLKFAWIDFRRSFLASSFSLVSQVITYSAITISIGLFSIFRPTLNWTINTIFYNAYNAICILFIVICVIIGGIVTSRSIDLKIQSQRDDIGIMKNVGGKSRWIYSYFIFNQLLTAVIMLILGIILGISFLAIVLSIFHNTSYLNNVKFIPVLISNIIILLINYVKSHYTIVKFIGEKNFEQSSSKLSNYKSIFEFNNIIDKFSASVKLGVKNFLRSGKIIASFMFSFFLVFSLVTLIVAPLAMSETYKYHYESRFNSYEIVIGNTTAVNFYNQSMAFQAYENTTYEGDLSRISQSFIDDIDNLDVEFQTIYLTKMEVEEIPFPEVTGGVYTLVGYNRTFYASIVGYSDNFIAEELFIWGSYPNPSRNEVLIGDSLERIMFENSSVEKIRIQEESVKYSIKGVVLDSFAAGFTVYIPLNKLRDEGITTGPNLIMFDEINETTYNNVKSISESYGYQMQDISEIRDLYKEKYSNFSNMYNVLGIGLFGIFSFQVIVFCFLYFLIYRKDYKLLRDLGIPKRKLYSINYTATILQTIPGIILGGYFGSVIPRYFLIPNAKITLFGLMIIGIVMWFILLISLGSISASRRGIKKEINKIT
jgi:hypothetical protein